MKKTAVVLLTILMLFSLLKGALRENVVKADGQPIWSMFRYNAQNTGQCPYSTLNNGGGLKWKFNVNGGSAPVIGSDGTIYIGSGFLYALNPDGTLKWKYQGDSPGGFSAPAIGYDGTIYAVEYPFFYALNPDGTLKWKYQIDVRIFCPIIAPDGTIYFQTMPGSSMLDAYLYALNADGSLKWKYRTGGWASYSDLTPSIGQDGTIYVGGVELNESQYNISYLYAIKSNGTLKWKYQVDSGIWAPAAISSDGTIYVGSWDGYFYAINNNGTLKWKKNFYYRLLACPAIGSDGTIYVGSDFLYALDPDGNEKWKFKGVDTGFCSPIISLEGTIYSMDHSCILYAINADGTLKWKYKRGGNLVYNALAIGSDGTIYVLSNDIHALNGPCSQFFNILASAGPGGSISPSGSLTAKYGENKTFVITPNHGYKIKDIKVNGSSQFFSFLPVISPYTYTLNNVSSDLTIEVTFELDEKLSLDVVPPVVSIFSPLNGTRVDTSTIKIKGKATDNVGVVSVWVGATKADLAPDGAFEVAVEVVEGANNLKVIAYDAAGNKSETTITIIYEKKICTITASATFGGSISPSGNITVNYGDSKTFTITPNSGYKISSVKVDGVSKGAIFSYTFTDITSDHTITATFEKEITQIVIILHIGNPNFTVNGSPRSLDSPPIIKNGRTLLPIRAVVEALGGTIEWIPATKGVTVRLGSTYIGMQIGNPTAVVNGNVLYIDSSNLNVVPEIINSRTMLPLRFVAESLGCDVQWDGTTKTITITYPKP
ncbi:MAG: outer membrane biogenesis protein BamB [Methanomethylovorans sp. PtaU1.Bin073]|nr:MAG: outer membrane biogenesis protein BamB [Methanomethylovorans sp. PtaU1.Bin073]